MSISDSQYLKINTLNYNVCKLTVALDLILNKIRSFVEDLVYKYQNIKFLSNHTDPKL